MQEPQRMCAFLCLPSNVVPGRGREGIMRVPLCVCLHASMLEFLAFSSSSRSLSIS